MIVIDIAHGHSVVMARAIDAFRKRFGDVELVAGNVATADGVRFLLERGVNGIKVGIGPGGGCTTRLNTNFGVPQVQALVECREAADGRVPLIADGGVKRDGALVQALLFGGDTVMLGSALAGTIGDAGRHRAEAGRRSRVAQDRARAVQGVSRDGVAAGDRRSARRRGCRSCRRRGARRRGDGNRVPARGSVRPMLRDMLKHLCSAISYGGARSLGELQEMFRTDPGALRHSADGVRSARIIRSIRPRTPDGRMLRRAAVATPENARTTAPGRWPLGSRHKRSLRERRSTSLIP